MEKTKLRKNLITLARHVATKKTCMTVAEWKKLSASIEPSLVCKLYLDDNLFSLIYQFWEDGYTSGILRPSGSKVMSGVTTGSSNARAKLVWP